MRNSTYYDVAIWGSLVIANCGQLKEARITFLVMAIVLFIIQLNSK